MTLTQLIARVATMITRGVVSLVDDDPPVQLLQVEGLEGVYGDGIENFQPYGVSFHPPVGSEALLAAVCAAQEHIIAVGVGDRDNRPTGASEGEGGLHYLGAWKVYLSNDGRLHLSQKAATQSFVRGEDMRDALVEYANAVTEAVGLISYSGAGSVVGSTAAAALADASLSLLSALNGSLSDRVKGE